MKKRILSIFNTLAATGIYCLSPVSAQAIDPADQQAAEDKKPEAVIPRLYGIFDAKLNSAHYNHNGLIRGKQALQSIIKENKITDELALFMNATDFSKQSLFLFSFVHQGSGSDRPAYKLKQVGEVLKCILFDENQNAMRTADLRSQPRLLCLRVDKDKIKEIKVEGQGLGPNQGRSFYTNIDQDFGLDQAARIIAGLESYRGKQADEIKNLKVFECKSYNLSEEDIKAISMLPKLERVHIRNSSWTSSEVKHLNNLKHLRELSVGGHYLSWSLSGAINNFNNEHLKILDIPTLESIDISSSKVNSHGLAQLARFPKLQEVGLGHIQLDDEAGRHLAKLKQCTGLYGMRIPSIDFISNLAQLPKLQKLNIAMSSVDLDEERKIFQQLGEMKSLVWLHVGDTHHKMDDDTIAPLAELTQLKHLGLVGYHEITDEGVVNCIKNMKGLESLSLGRATKVGDAWIKQVGKLPLKRLDVRQNQVTNQGTAWIAEAFPNIEEINLRHNKAIDNGAVKHLRKMEKLKHLNPMNYQDGNNIKGLLEGVSFYDGDEPYHDSWTQKYH